MSRIEVDEDAQQIRVVIPPVKKLPPNPHIESRHNLARALAPPSDTTQTDNELSSESRDDKTLRYRLLACDQRSFLTGSAVADLQAAHVINPIHRNVLRKNEVEDFLTQQRLQPGRFLLDSPVNAILLESSLHTQWDLYGTFCFVPAEDDANAMLVALRKSNDEWAAYDQPSLGPTRPLDVSKAPFNRPSWDVIVFHPSALLPDGLALGIAKDRFFYVAEQSAPASQLTWTWWTASGDCLRSTSHPHEPFAPFVATDVRAGLRYPPVSSLAMIINANCKLQQFLHDYGPSVPPRVQRYSELISALVTEIFFVPDGFDNVAVHSHSLQIVQYAQSITGVILQQNQKIQDPQHPLETSYNSAYDAMGDAPAPSGEDPLCAIEYPEVPNTDGLTDSEFRLISAKARDSGLDRKERANAAMLMLFGTRRYEDPYMHRPQVIYD